MNIGGKEYALTAQTADEAKQGTCVGCAFDGKAECQVIVDCAFNVGEVYKEVTK